MRPLKLIISGFGPYANLQTVDFEELKNKNIFLITGPTGAGKTTIFDAISYALFGEASGSSRSKDSLRSDFATQETLTYVELDFELRGKVYKVKRVPQQERKKLKGEGTVQKNTEAELILPSGEIITRVTAVDEKISRVLGINKNQFRQIVMLPQGEFRKLLEAESIEREAIFRKIFGTEAFETIQRKLEDQRKSISKKIGEKQTRRDTHAKNIETGGDEALHRLIYAKDMNIAEIINRTKLLIEEDEKKNQEIAQEIKGIIGEQEKLQQQFVEGQETNKKINDKIELEKEYTDHVLKEKEYKEKNLRLERGRKTLPIIELENTYIQREKALEMRHKEYREATESLNIAKDNLLQTAQQIKIEEAKEPERKKISDEIATLKSRQEKVKEYEDKKLNIEKQKKELENKEKTLQGLKFSIKEEKNKLQLIYEGLKEIQKAEIDLEKLINIRDQKQEILEDARNLYKYTKQYITKANKYKKEIQAYEELDNKFKEIKLIYETMEDSFRRGQAGLLARDLRDGMECPVCGSSHHPKPAEAVEDVPTEEEIKKMKLKLDKAAEERDKKYGEVSRLHGDIQNSEVEVLQRKNSLLEALGQEIKDLKLEAMLPYLEKQGEMLSSELKSLEEQLNSLEMIVKEKNKLETDLNQCEDNINKNQYQVEELEKVYTQDYGVVKAGEELLISIEKEIPLAIRSYTKLTSKINEIQGILDKLQQSHKKAQENYSKASNDHAFAEANCQTLWKSLEEEKQEIEALKLELENRIKAAGFNDYTEYHVKKMKEEQIKELETDILEYYQNLKSLKDRVEKAIKDTKDLKEVSLEKLIEDLKQLKNRKNLLEPKEKQLFSRINNNKKALREIEKINEDIRKDEEVFGVVGELSKVANGDNEERITFERYVLAAYFDEIINASNIRLNKMAGGRYILRRKEERGKGRRQEGLELEVFDNYTGKARHVKTLSGGESFKASLALALGLADVVQSYAGGISLDTMFVDEGFGTLDPESLDHAIQCLIDLQMGGRLVGIISHVPELKERIDVRLEITPAKEGSRVKFAV
ncbi:AAA family ATPase [Natronincola ferrireducens]|uniref:Nuclease SbcCD subunit C n=1 Tax=Natronincola ferrireducens TaxID=393762 RepID=A0A1G9AAV6_9FIRM|nr:AAA family ATPase [Natronincola ferrireducens]SDK24489.1 exonuclease SbcC [Natronincola ferrireducens]